MKKTVIASAMTSALLTVGTLHAAVSLNPSVGKLVQPNLNPQEIVKRSLELDVDSTSPLQNDGLNVQIRQQQKFQREDGITGAQVYIVTLLDKPAAAASYSAQTESAIKHNDNKLFAQGKAISDDINAYEQQLLSKQQDVLQELSQVVGVRDIRQQFTKALNGFSLELTQDEAELVAQNPNVRSVKRSKTYQLQSDAGPQWIGADKIWQGVVTNQKYQGEGIVVGIVDTGINTDHPSFAAVGQDGYQHVNPFGAGNYVGDCAVEGQQSMCNDKLIGVHSYAVITDNFTSGVYGAKRPATGEDYNGHGSHTASTAAGNVLLNQPLSLPELKAQSDGEVFKADFFPRLSGVAPHANIIAYQVCHPANAINAGCPGEALVAGIEDAIQDGVDVINFSIGGQDSNPWADDVELAFLAARKAGISVAVAAGNSGQTGGAQEYFGAIDHASPWLLNVAATTHNRQIKFETLLKDPSGGSQTPVWSTIAGGAVNSSEVRGVVVKAVDFGNEYCGNPFPAGTFDNIKDANGNPTNVIVVCKRNSLTDTAGVARTLKADNVKAAGGDGMILYNYANGDGVVSAAKYSIPTAHITKEEWDGRYDNGMNGYGLSDWLAKGTKHTLTIGATSIDRVLDDSKADWLAAFSSRGPSPSTPEALIPAVAAPGVDVYAAYSDEQPFTSSPSSGDFTPMSGTSMASPHAAGAMALLRQAHPDWTPAEIQSALTMTADNKVQYHRLNVATGPVGLASTYRAGTGRINVANAVQAGLVMDETATRFEQADPHNGGVVHKLNLPQLVNFGCKPKCTWIRTVKATRDGEWTVSNSDVLNWDFDMNNQVPQNGVTIVATPSTFSLKAGETQTIVVEASIMDTQDIFSNSEVELHSSLIFTEKTNRSPEAHWPVVFQYSKNGMPANLTANTHGDQGKYVFKDIKLPEGQAVGRVMTPVKATIEEFSLPKDLNNVSPWYLGMDPATPMDQRIDESTTARFITVPANARRLIVESQGTVASDYKGTINEGNISIYVGKDYNGNGKVDLDSELLCMSAHVVMDNFCNINNPEPGTYWALMWNSIDGATSDPIKTTETFKIATAVVTDSPASNMDLSIPTSDGQSPVDVTLNYTNTGMAKGDVYYSLVDFGSSAANPQSIGKVSLKLTRGADDVELSVPRTGAVAGDKVPYTFAVLPNNSGRDRKFKIEAKVPAGLNLKESDVLASRKAMISSVKVADGVLTIEGTQPDTSDLQPSYTVSSNETDASCKVPSFGNSNPGGYVNLEEFGFVPSFSGFAPVVYGSNGNAVTNSDNNIMYRSGISVPVKTFFNGYFDSFHLYNNTDDLNMGNQNSIQIHPFGIVTTWQQPFFYAYHLGFPYNSFPYESIGMLWRGMSFFGAKDIMSVPLQTSGQLAGISMASTATGWGIIEFDDARSYASNGRDSKRVYQWTEKDDRFDFELVFNVNTRFGDGEHELYMAYDNINFGTQDARGAIGLQGFKGLATSFGPLGSYLSSVFAQDNWGTKTFELKDKLKSGLVVCYDYQGPESSQFEITAWTTVNNKATGQVQNFTAKAQFDDLGSFELAHALNVPSNLSIGSIKDQTVAENSVLKDLVVYYADESNTANTISVSGAHIKGTVSGHTSGSTLTITPDADFHGETEVTVTVTDSENPNDYVSTSFMLNVVSDGIEKGCTDKTALNYNPVANKDDGSCKFPAVTQPEATKDTSGGSFGLFGLPLLALLAARRRQRH